MSASPQYAQPFATLQIERTLGNYTQLLYGQFTAVPKDVLAPRNESYTDTGGLRIEFDSDPRLTHPLAGFQVPVGLEITHLRTHSRFTVSESTEGFLFHLLAPTEGPRGGDGREGTTTLWVSTYPYIAVQSLSVYAFGRQGISDGNLAHLMPSLDVLVKDAITNWAAWNWMQTNPNGKETVRNAAIHQLRKAVTFQNRNREQSVDLSLVAELVREAKRDGRAVSPYVAAQMGLGGSKEPTNYARQLIYRAKQAGFDLGD